MDQAWRELRRDFPALETYAYLNAAAASPTPRPVAEAVAAFHSDLERNGDRHWDRWIARREEARAAAARLIGASPEEIAFVPNTSTGINLAVDLVGGDGPVLTDDLEFPTVTLPFVHRGVPVYFLPAQDGIVRPDSFDGARAPEAATIAISHVQFSNGCRQDLGAFGALKAGRHLVVSGSQSVGAFPVDVKASGVDILATAGHKWLCAGYGAGFVYVSQALLRARPPRAIGWLSVHDPFAFDNRRYRLLESARRYELGCPSFAPLFALGAAAEYVLGIGIDAISQRVLALNEVLTDGLTRAGFQVLSPGGPHRSGETLVAVSDPRPARRALEARGVVVTEKPEGLRISTHFYNDEEDLERCLAALRECVRPR